MTKYLVKIYLNDGNDKTLFQAFDKEFDSYGDAEKYVQKYINEVGGFGDNDSYTDNNCYTFELSDNENDLELCDFFDKCLKYAVQTAINNPELAKNIYVENMSPESVKQAYDDYNSEYEYGDEE